MGLKKIIRKIQGKQTKVNTDSIEEMIEKGKIENESKR